MAAWRRQVLCRFHLHHRWQERNRGKDDRWEQCRDCGKRRNLLDAGSALFKHGPGPGL
jgi:hypothetical protein